MDTSLFLAKLLGLYLIVASLLWLVRGQAFDRMVEALMDDPGIRALSGFLSLVIGLAMVTAHSVWEPNWRSVITVFGYLALGKGIWLLGWPEAAMSVTRVMVRSPFRFPLVGVWLLLGCWLAWLGFSGASV